jgi:methionyl-tRNA formyltransferase
VRLVVAGTPEVALPSLALLNDSAHEVAAVITRPDAQSGRGRQVHRSPVARWADEHDLPVLQPARPRDPEFLAALASLSPDCCPVIAYGALIPVAALDVPRFGWINLHFSLLPAWRGAAPVQHAIMSGDEVTGASTFLIEEGLDTGPVYGMLTETIRADDTSGALLERLAAAGAELLLATMDGVESGELVAVPQSSHGVSLAPKVTPEQALVDWRAPAMAIDRQIRGCTPAPGAWTTFRGERLGLGPVRLADPRSDSGQMRLAPGTIQAGKRAVLVGTATGPVELGAVRPAGKREMAAADWARGTRPDAGELLGAAVSQR